MDNKGLIKDIEDIEDNILDAIDVVDNMKDLNKRIAVIEKKFTEDFDMSDSLNVHIGNIIYLKNTIEKYINETSRMNVIIGRLMNALKSSTANIKEEVSKFSTKSFIYNLEEITGGLIRFIKAKDTSYISNKNEVLEYLDRVHEMVIDTKNFVNLYRKRIEKFEDKEILIMLDENKEIILDNLFNHGTPKEMLEREYDAICSKIKSELYVFNEENNTSILTRTLSSFHDMMSIIKKNILKIK